MTTPKNPKNQGEGDRESAKRYNEDQRQFVGEHDEQQRERLAREAKPRDAAEAADLKQAEAIGRQRSKAGDESGQTSAPPAGGPGPVAGGGGTEVDERDSADRPTGNREVRSRDDAGTRRRGRFLRRRR
jgi:hypothetical protein